MTGYIGGLSSGLDTASMIEQLLEVERAPIQRLERNKRDLQAKDEAWTDISTRLSGLRTALDQVSTSGDFEQFLVAGSSHPGRVAAAVTGPAEPQTLGVTVGQLAARHEVVSGGGFSSSESLVGAGTFEFEVDGVTHEIGTTASTTLGQLASAIGDLDAGVKASVIMVDGSTAKLRLVASATGAGSVFTASGDQAGFGSFDVVRAGQDAELSMGALTLTRSSNTVTDLVPGVTLDLVSAGPEEITLTVARDTEGAIEAVSAVVEQLNNAISRLKQMTAYNPESGQSGPLMGDATARRILMDLQSSLSSVTLDDGPYTHAGSIGIEIQRDGTVGLDEGKLRSALEDDFAAVSRLLARNGATSAPGLEYVRSAPDTADGTYQVEITQAASTAAVTGAAYTAPGADVSFQVASGANVADVTVTAGATLAEAVDAVNASLSAAGISTVTAEEDGGAVRLTESRYGTARTFSVTGSGAFGLDGSHAGADVQGTIAGEASTGSGRILTAESGDPDGVSVSVLASPAEVAAAGGALTVGDVKVGGGLVGAVSRSVSAAEGIDGSIRRARDHWESQIDLVDDRIESFEDRLVRVEEQLIRQFTAMEQALSQLQSQQAWMQSQLAGLDPNS